MPWFGPVFWPYAYNDIFYYTFWPQAYDEAYWLVAYDDFFDTVFWGPHSAPYAEDLDAALEEPTRARATTGSRPSRERTSATLETLQQLCGDLDKGITAWPFASMEQQLQLNAEQRLLLE